MGKIVLSLLFLLSLTACNGINLSSIPGASINAQSIGSFCTYDPTKLDHYMNYLFIMDYSGSNSQTDPSATRVTKAIAFIDAHKNDPFTQFGAIMFDSNQKAAIYQTNEQTPILTSDQNLITQGEARLKAGGPGSSTNYSAAIQMGQQAIQADITANPDRLSTYEVFFITDGQPNEGTTSQSGLVGIVQGFVNLSPGNIYFSTAYYGNDGSQSLLQAMAQAGNGNFENLNNTSELNFDGLVVTGPSVEPWMMKNFMVYNLNSAICDDGTYGMDSSGSGVCDVDKIKYGLNVQKRSTPSDGYNDFFHYLVATHQMDASQLTPCTTTDQTDDDMDLLNNCEERLLRNQNPSGTKSMTADPKNPDTDGDGLIDGLEPIIFRSTIGSAMDNQDVLIDWNGMGLSAYTQIFQHRNPMQPNQGQPGYDANVKFAYFTDKGQSCYTYSQSQLQLYHTLPTQDEGTLPYLKGHNANENRVLIYFFQTPTSNPSGEGMYMYSFQTLNGNANANNALGTAAGLQINDGVFTPYVIPKKK